MDIRKEDGRWVSSGRSENSVMMREELMFEPLSSHAPALLTMKDYHA
jgi:hypothetical protein